MKFKKERSFGFLQYPNAPEDNPQGRSLIEARPPVPKLKSKGNGQFSVLYQNEEGRIKVGALARSFTPTDDYRSLLSPETRAALEGR